MAKWMFVAFAVACAAQRYLEVRRYDRRIDTRRPHWTAVALIVIHTTILLAAVIELLVVSPVFQPFLFGLGSLLFVLGFLLRRWVIRTLSDQWSIDVEQLENHRLITTGPFAWCRHPNYLAILMEVSGYCLIGHALYTLTFGLPIYAVLLAARIVAEEKSLVNTFGDDYLSYRRRRTALLPVGGLLGFGRRK